jgi:non-homologous end joining protein Ku
VSDCLYPATTEREKISFNQLNKETGNRIRYRKVDAETGDEVPQENIIKGYEVAKGEYIEIEAATKDFRTLGHKSNGRCSACRRARRRAPPTWPRPVGAGQPLGSET